jgi:DNA polymerase III delta subunit
VRSTGKASIKDLLSKESPPSLLVLSSPDRVRLERIFSSFTSRFFPDTQAVRFEGGELTAKLVTQNLNDSLSSLSLFSSKILVIISNAELIKSDVAEKLEAVIKQHFKRAFSDCSLVIYGSGKLSTKITKVASSYDLFFEFEAISGEELERWIQKESNRLGIAPKDNQALHSLISASQENLDNALKMLSQIALYLEDTKKSFSKEDIKALFPEVGSADEFQIISALSRGSSEACQKKLDEALTLGHNPFLLLNLLFRTITQSIRLKELLEAGIDRSRLATISKTPPWLINKQLPLVDKYTRLNLTRSLDALIRADSLLKNKNLGAQAVLAQALHTLVRLQRSR